MKALTLYQPWATLVAIGAKTIETRSWGTRYCGPLAIHAGKNIDFIISHSVKYICADEPFKSVLAKAGDVWPLEPFPLGCIVAVCDLVCCKRIGNYELSPNKLGWLIGDHFWKLSDQERAFGDFTQGRFMWFLYNIVKFPKPIIATGAQGLWDWKQEVFDG
jgi:hypothetical protein